MSNWTFCKDELPSEHGRYLVVYPVLTDEIYIEILHYGIVDSAQSEPFFYEFDSEFGDVEYDDVIAWMPLPELWEGADDKEPRVSEIIEAYTKGYEDGAGAVKQTFVADGIVFEKIDELQTDCEWKGEDL